MTTVENDGSQSLSASDRVLTEFMEQLHEGYVQSVAASAGCTYQCLQRDVHGIDAELIRPALPPDEEASVRIQLKSTSTMKPNPAKKSFGYTFKKREYADRLTMSRNTIKRLLVVMIIHPNQRMWTRNTHDELVVQHCCYWANLEGLQLKKDLKYPTVQVPTANIFDAESLIMIMDKLERGERP